VATAGMALSREIRSLRAQLERRSADLEAAREEYQRRLAADAAMQAERAAAAKAIGYRPGQSNVAHNANMLREFVAFMGTSGDLRKRIEKVDGSDPKDIERLATDLEEVLNKGLGTLGQIVLRNTEPAKDEKPAKPPAPVAKP
jgi:DNA repair exonuclease SbcCD ATPase subunit